MHPISKVHFGPEDGKIAVRFHNGNSVVQGYIVKQVATKKFVVTEDGTDTFTCKLAADGTPADGEMTINVYPFSNGAVSNVAEHATSILANHVNTAEGNRYIWTREEPTVVGYALIETVEE